MDKLDFTTATRSQLECIWKAISDETGDDRFFTTKELDALPGEVSPGEQVLSFSSGQLDGNSWLIVLTDERILFLDKGLLYGMKKVSIEINRISNIESERGLMFGKIVVGANGRLYPIEYVWKRTVDPFVNKARLAMRAWANGETLIAPGTAEALALANPAPAAPETPATTETPASPVDIVPVSSPAHEANRHWNERLSRLRAAGVITEAQYQQDLRA